MRTTTDQKRQLRGLVLDVDGTLLDPGHRVTPTVSAAVARARAAGLHVLLASGRSPRAMRDVLDDLDMTGPAIAFNGAVTFRLAGAAIEPLAGTTLDPAAAADVLGLAAEHGVEIGWFTLDGWRVAAPGPAADEEAELTGEAPLIDPGLPAGAAAPYKLMAIAVTQPQTAALGALRSALPRGVHGVFSHPRYLEVVAPGVDKAAAVRAAAAGLGLVPAQLAAIGDAENDIGMLREAGVAIAMGNAAPAVIAAAGRTTATNAEGGVALAIDELLASR